MLCWDYDNIAQVQLAFAVAAGNNHNNNASADVDADADVDVDAAAAAACGATRGGGLHLITLMMQQCCYHSPLSSPLTWQCDAECSIR